MEKIKKFKGTKETKETKEARKAEEAKKSVDLNVIKELKEKNCLKASRKRKLKEVRKKLWDISSIVESIAIEEEKQTEVSHSEIPDSDKELQNIENLRAAVHGIQASILLIDSTLD